MKSIKWKLILRKSILALSLTSTVIILKAQDALTNQSIISLVKAGVEKSVVLTTISSAAGKYDTSAQGLINLKKQGVSADIINAMIVKSSGTKNDASKQKTLKLELQMLNHPYFLDKDGVYKPLEKNIGEIKTKLKGLGYGGSETNYELDGEKSNTSLKKDEPLQFLVNTGEGQSLVLSLYKTSVKKGKRLALFSSAKVFGKNNSSDFTVPFNTSIPQAGLYKIELSKQLEVGEYMFVGKSTNGLVYDVFSFSINQ